MSIRKNAKWWNNGEINKRSIDCPGPDFVLGRKKFSRAKATEETKQKISESLKGNTPWNKGLKTGPESEQTRLKKSQALKGNTNGFKADQDPWNKGLTKEDHNSIKLYASKQSGQRREGNYVNGEDHPCFNPNKTEFDEYKYIVYRLTEKVYYDNIDIINPNGHIRGKAGVEGAWQLDHIIPVHYGFVNGISAEEIASVDNLQMLPWKDNIVKSNSYE